MADMTATAMNDWGMLDNPLIAEDECAMVEPRVTANHEDINSNARVLLVRNAIRFPCNRRVASNKTRGTNVGDGPSDRNERINSTLVNIVFGYPLRMSDCSDPSMLVVGG